MKKLLFVLFGLSIFAFSAFAITGEAINNDVDTAELYEAEKTTTISIVPEKQHTTDKYADVRLEYAPMYDEVRVYYRTANPNFDQGEAMNTVLAVLQDFQKEHKYLSYRYLQEPKLKTTIDKNVKPKKKYTLYFCYVQMVGKTNIGEVSSAEASESESDSE